MDVITLTPMARRAYELGRLLKRVFDIDIEHCPYCGGALKILAAILANRNFHQPPLPSMAMRSVELRRGARSDTLYRDDGTDILWTSLAGARRGEKSRRVGIAHRS